MKWPLAFLFLSLIVPAMADAPDLASLEATRTAATQGNADAQLDLGILYEFGYNMPKNEITALAWYMRSAEQGNALAANRRDLLKSHMKSDEVAAAQKLASELAAPKSETPATPAPSDQKPETTEPPQANPEPAAAGKNPENTATAPAADSAGEKSPAPEPAAEKPPATP
jgi:TPR repeat protein